MRLFLVLICVTAASAYRYSQDGAEYDEEGNRVYSQNYYRSDDSYDSPEYSQLRYRRQNQGNPRLRPSKRQLTRPAARPVDRSEKAESSNRREYIFRPGQQRKLRTQPSGSFKQQRNQAPQQQRVPVYAEPQQASRPVRQQPSVDRKSGPLLAPVRSAPPPSPVRSQPHATERFYVEPEQKEVFERNADLDQLGGESFQPAYTPYSAPKTAYDNSYTPPEQKSIQESVAAGAASYNGESYEDPQRLSFQIHGQEGPHSYRFGYDTGIGYNRQFRYEERDNYGVLHGRYGYYDQEGKLQVVNYTADPKTGFHADGKHVPKPQY